MPFFQWQFPVVSWTISWTQPYFDGGNVVKCPVIRQQIPAFVKLDPGLCVSGGSFGDVFLAYGSAGLSQLEFSWENHPILRHSQRPAGKAFKSQNLSQPYGWLIPALKWSHYSYTMKKLYENTPLIHYYKFK